MVSHQYGGHDAEEVKWVSCSLVKGCKESSYQDVTETSIMPVALSLGTTADISFEGHFGFLEEACQLSFVAENSSTYFSPTNIDKEN